MDYEDRARKIIAENIYLTLATSGKDGTPWISPVYFAYDENYNFYWTSAADARHSRYLKGNEGKAAFVIFNSNAKEKEGDGVYFEGRAYELNDEKAVSDAVKIFYARKGAEPRPVLGFMGPAPRRLYKAVFERAWINTDEKIGGYHIDKKVELKLR